MTTESSSLERAAALHRAGRLDEAESVYRGILSVRPGDPNALHLLGLIEYARARMDAAIELIAEAVTQQPENAVFHGNLGEAYRRSGDLGLAETHLRRAIELDPDLADAHNNLGILLRRKGWLDVSAAAHQAAIRANPANPDYFMNAALIARDQGDAEAAMSAVKHALALAPERAEYHNTLGNLLIDAGRSDEAATAYRRAIALDPGLGSAYWNLATCRRYTRKDTPEITTMEDRYRSDGLRASARADLAFALGKVHDDIGDYDRAFAFFEQANTARRPPFDPRDYIDYIDRVIVTYTRPFLASVAGYGAPSERPVFIVGMIRSGTTLVEQILAAHPAVEAAGELRDIALLTERTRDQGEMAIGYPESMTRTTAPVIQALADAYLEPLRHRFSDADRVTDKMPSNFLHLGFIQALLPNARVIHCRRDPLDTCLSAYFQNFTEPPPFASDLAGLGTYFRHYRRLMDHWHGVLSLPMIEVDYGALVTDPDTQIRRIVAFCGLPWDNACLAPHIAPAQVRTASAWQVRQPINAGSVGRWRHYKRHLVPLIEALGPHAPLTGGK